MRRGANLVSGRVFVPAPQPLDLWPCPAVDTWPRPAQRTVPGERPRAAAGPGGPEGRPRQKAQPCAVRQVGSPRAPWGGAACSVPPRRRGAPGAPTGGRRLAQPSCCADSGTAPASFSSGAGRPGTSPRCPAGARGVRWGAGLADPARHLPGCPRPFALVRGGVLERLPVPGWRQLGRCPRVQPPPGLGPARAFPAPGVSETQPRLPASAAPPSTRNLPHHMSRSRSQILGAAGHCPARLTPHFLGDAPPSTCV